MPAAGDIGSMKGKILFSINGKLYEVGGGDVGGETSLNTFIRETVHLKGTKVMCREGGCGACIVSVSLPHPATGQLHTLAVNSCMVPVYSCHGWDITTVEGLGSKKEGYHEVVRRLVAAHGTQCGYCTPGMVMNMYSLLQSKPDLTMKEVENSFGGNICRCTGYRPILDAFKSLASDAPEKLVSKLTDIEDICPKNKKVCSNGCAKNCSLKTPSPLELELSDGVLWFKPSCTQDVFSFLEKIGNKKYRFVAGNTGQGVYRYDGPAEAYIDLTGIQSLQTREVTGNGLSLGGGVSLTEGMELFSQLAREQPHRFLYLAELAKHIDLIANLPVRNTGSFSGNLMLKHTHPEFPSDIFLILELVGAKVVIADQSGVSTVDLLSFLRTDMKKKLIVRLLLPHIDSKKYIVRTYKIMPRAQNAHAYVNAGFKMSLDKSGKEMRVIDKPTILFGGILPSFLHAEKTEDFLIGKSLTENRDLQAALETLEAELEPDHVLPDPSPQFRRGLALSLLYKFVLSVTGAGGEKASSGGRLLEREVSSGLQDYQSNPKVWPLNQPVHKIEAAIQTAGLAEYTNDMPNIPGELWGQLVLSRQAKARFSIDPTQALKLPGVVAFFSAKDIPGTNTFILPSHFGPTAEPIFAEGETHYAGEALGVVLAESQDLARRAAALVRVEYTRLGQVFTDARQVIRAQLEDRIKELTALEAKATGDQVTQKISGSWDIGGQYHFTMETQTCLAVPTEDHLELFAATQWPACLQEVVSTALNIPENNIDIRVRRLGGGYGAKITRASHVGVVASLSAYLLSRPVRLVLDLETNMEWAGKRFPVLSDYEVGVNDSGEIQYLKGNVYQNDGWSGNESPLGMGSTFHHAKSCYDNSRWSLKAFGVTTDTASNTWCRAPGSTEGISFIENIMEHISKATGLDPVSVRLANMEQTDRTLVSLIADIKSSSDYENRERAVEEFNRTNRWKKRGISLVPMNYPFSFWGNHYGMVSIYGLDGTVAITTGAIEMGQGVNTKAAQVAAHILGVPLESVSVKPTTSLTSPNNCPTGGSLGSEAVCYAVKVCCEKLNERLKPARESLKNSASWLDVIHEAIKRNINLNYTYMFTNDDDVKNYAIYGVTVVEVEVDILTGQYHCRRVDILEDAGESLSPEVDIGQVEGAFVMGLGYYTSEELVFASDTGRLLTNRTWNYKPPGAKDIPIDFRVTLRKNAPNPTGVLRSKATGEPPLCMSCAVVFALRNALLSARRDAGSTDSWLDIHPPFTGEKLWMGALNKKEMYVV